MNLKIALALLFVVTATTTYAQDVFYSEYDKFDYRNDEYSVVGMVDHRLYTYEYTGGEATLIAYDDSMNKTAKVLLDFFPDKIYQAQFIAYPDKMIVLYQAIESNNVVQYAALLDNRGLLKNKPIQIGSVKTGIFGATKAYFSASVSEDKKTILIYSVDDRGGGVEFDGKWLTDDLTIEKRSKASFSADNKLTHGEVNVGNDGTVYLAAYTTLGQYNYADQYYILTLPKGATAFYPKELALGEKYAANGYMKLDNVNGCVYFGGFYADKKNGGYNGIIYAVYDIATGTFPSSKLIPFDGDLAEAGSSRRVHAFDNYQVKQIIAKGDGGFVLISEIEYVTTRSTYTPGFGYYSFYSPNMTTIVHDYHFDDIMALSYTKDGSREWGAVIPKSQNSQEDGGVFSSYSLLNSGGHACFPV